jgi:hypothetical protein
MRINPDDEIENNQSIIDQRNERIKQQFLEEDFKKANDKVQKKEKTKEKKFIRKKPFFLLGVFLIIIGASCYTVVNQGPWLYVNYEPMELENVTVEKLYYYKDLQMRDIEDLRIRTFLESESKEYLGISSTDFSTYFNMTKILSYTLILLGIAFIILNIAFKIFDFEYKKLLVLHSFFAATFVIICIYIIFGSAKFLAAFILYFLNYDGIVEILGGSMVICIMPLILIVVFSLALSICFIILKADYKELETIFDSKKSKESPLNARYHRGLL